MADPEPLAPTIVETKTIPLDDLSTAPDSGWREDDERRVDELEVVCKDGSYGQHTMALPSVQVDDAGREKLSTTDGRRILNNGKSIIMCLKRLKREFDAAEEKPEWAKGLLLSALTEGVRVDVLKFPSDDVDLMVSWQALAHNEENNKYRITSIGTKIAIVKRISKKVGGSSPDIVKAMLQMYGGKKKPMVYRSSSLKRRAKERRVSGVAQGLLSVPRVCRGVCRA